MTAQYSFKAGMEKRSSQQKWLEEGLFGAFFFSGTRSMMMKMIIVYVRSIKCLLFLCSITGALGLLVAITAATRAVIEEGYTRRWQ